MDSSDDSNGINVPESTTIDEIEEEESYVGE
jgi:hypothetical protein